ncbi:BZ3500_MvSof-1268-A1-R1_Chr1-3g02077 [Microbotryum saponariae]|uniref:BZ3500_MvSof-1268-A1-R1_Chr1-3g02077 protein n=1 Tax=Microbotryum saponariae TaxID=289078 RepID=A0A2X0KG61_9BASI|nr:BZ3500_MvSof-1268-A1-R1_Chr1-3g02077 [Microbotryum saponariae]SCZ95345.1 BZ3501_MvSof-1269-A2-R1_Chr1-3g01679 [Microbotryum saponariae]
MAPPTVVHPSSPPDRNEPSTSGSNQRAPVVDPLPHGLPIRFSRLSVPSSSSPLLGTPAGGGTSEALVATLGSAMIDLISLGPVRRVVRSTINQRHRAQEDPGTTLSERERRDRTRSIVAGVEGVVHQGEMLLIVGPPPANVSTLLRALSSPSDLPISASSHLDYGQLPPSTVNRPSIIPPYPANAGKLRSQVVYMNDNDVHFATLSLRNSMLPGSLAKTPGTRARLDGSTRRQWADSQLNRHVDAMGLSHAMGTKVGSPVVRGLSGGERKRASLVEALLTRASVLLLEAPTSGLDSSTALSVLTYLRHWAKRGKRSIVATAPHIADPLYFQFDKVLVLNSAGRQIYFGKTSDAQAYYETLGLGFHRRTELGEGVAEFLVACNEGRGNDLALEKAWIKSEARQQVANEIADYDKRYPLEECAQPLLKALDLEKSRTTQAHYTVSFLYQVLLLTRRQYALVYSELPGYVTKTVVNILLSITVGTLFFRLPPTSSAAFTRGSLLLLSIMFNAYLSLAELGKAIEGRDIVRRQGDWGFFGSSALALARVAGDIPLIFAQCLLFGTVTYLMAGLQSTWSHFFIYIIFVNATALNLSSMFRMFAAFSPGFEEAIRFCGICLNILVIFAGYFIPTPSMRKGLKWIHYVVDPISYSYEAVLANEFHNLNLSCSPDDIVPFGPTYTRPEYQTCLLAGSTPGSLTVSGDAYLAISYDFHYSHIWRNLGIMAAQAFVFLVIGVVATEFLHFASGGTKRVWARTKRVMKRLERANRWYKQRKSDEDDYGVDLVPMFEEDMHDDEEELIRQSQGVQDGSTLMWKNVCLWVDTESDTRRLLDHVGGYIKPGRVCALMGASGAGKSTLLNVLAGRTVGVVRGTILVDGIPPDEQFYRTTGFCEQFDLHDERSTIREALEFSALLRQDASIPRAEKLAYVDHVLRLLDLTSIQDAIIGTPSEGLNAEQRKRTTIAVEVVSRPRILYADEPTTGLDSKSALKVVKLLRRLARTGLAIICTIHQPSAETFNVFDDVLLLQRGGRQVYFGPRDESIAFFASLGKENTHQNPADFLLDVAGAGLASTDGEDPNNEPFVEDPPPDQDVAQKWKDSRECDQLAEELDTLCAAPKRLRRKVAVPGTWFECVELTKRVTRHYWRDPSFSYTKLFTSTIVPFVIGLSFFRVAQEYSIVSFQNRLFSVFLLLFVPVVWLNVIIFKIFKLRGLWEARERPSKIYGRTAFITSLLVSELPYSLACATLYFVIWYFLVGFPLKSETLGFAFLMIQLFYLFQSTWALWIVSLSPDIGTIANLLPFFLVSMEAFNGALMPYSQMPWYWRWLYYVSPFQHYVRSMLGNLLHGQPISCLPSELVTFESPYSVSCVDYMRTYLRENAGYLTNPASTTTCSFCKFSNGDDYLATLNIAYQDRWRSLGVLFAYTITNVIIAYGLVFYPVPWGKVLFWRQSGGRQHARAEMVATKEYEREVAEILTATTLRT